MRTFFAIKRFGNIQWHLFELTILLKITIAKSSIHRQNFTVTDMTHRASLSDLMTMHCQRDIDVHHFTRLGIRQILRCCPYCFTARRSFHRGDRRTQTTAPKKEASASTNALNDGQNPAMRIMSGL